MTRTMLLGLALGCALPALGTAQEAPPQVPAPPKAPDRPRHRPLIELFTSQG